MSVNLKERRGLQDVQIQLTLMLQIIKEKGQIAFLIFFPKLALKQYFSFLKLGNMVSIWLCSFTLLFKLQFLEGLQQSINPGSGVNYYGPAQKETLLTPAKDLLSIAEPKDCTKAPMNSTCTPDLQFHDPNQPCQVLEQILCDPTYRYRHFDGKCNNLAIGKLGMSRSCYLRFTQPSYDGYGGVRKAMLGGPLPEPRSISLGIFEDKKKLDRKVTFLFVIFGQLIAHDLSRALKPIKTKCCEPENSNNPECMPIKLSPDDPFYSKYDKTCMEFQRTEECSYCKPASRAQTNGATAAMDASFLYGEDEEKAKKLRAFDGTGELKYDPHGYLPISGKDNEDEFCREGQESKCFLNGDPRVNQHASLTGFTTVWLREHNRVAESLRQINPGWEEEQIFQESRRIVIAEFQCIAYQYFLPPLLSVRVMKEFGIYIRNDSDSTKYDPTALLDVWSDSAVGSYRLHSLIPSDIGSGDLLFRDTFSNPDIIRQGHTSELLQGSFYARAEEYDRYLVEDVTKYLYSKYQDLASINIQRGRDHGLAPYVEVVRFCSADSVNVEKFDDLYQLGLMTKKNAKILEGVYEDVRDVDMWVGMQMETRMKGSLLGPSAVCINAKQFFFTMKGDRFFYSHKGQTPSFIEDQRTEIKKKCSIARVLCDNTRIEDITWNPFFLESRGRNPVVSCEQIPSINLTLWKECDDCPKIPDISLTDPNIPTPPSGLSL
ncbi:Peroxidase [Araneus ventricosus]|uniref:Peroxidase n=1 Tax=Araneus ventricosus TaxID=182803 RepID=A0A4Y2FZD7_ARAVE|nr:Peroxidase [Araneus ventricosus]